MTRLRFDHTYAKDVGQALHASLIGRGFADRGGSVEHPGSQICRFIHFEARRPFINGQTDQYLEFCSIKEMDAFRALFLEENGREPSEREVLQPGYSLRAEGPLDEFFDTHSHQFATWQPRLEHKNYEWKKDAVTRLPGWNFMTFRNQKIPLLETWVTEYEPGLGSESKPRVLPSHPNGCSTIEGIILRDERQELRDQVSDLTSKMDDPIFWADQADPRWRAFLEEVSEKPSPHVGVVLSCANSRLFEKEARPDYEVALPIGRAYGIRLPVHAWDILVVEGRPRI